MRDFKKLIIAILRFILFGYRMPESDKDIWAICRTCQKGIPSLSGIHQQVIVFHPDNGRVVTKTWQWYCSQECISKAEPYPDDIVREWAEKHGYIERF